MINLVKKNNNEQGFTLVELMLALAIIGIVVSLSTGMIVNIFNIVRPSTERMSAKQFAEIRLTEISAYARNAEDIDVDKDIIMTNKDEEIKQENSKIIITDKDSQIIIRSFSNIKEFNITNDNSVYEIEIKKCRDSECNETVSVKTEIKPRNIDSNEQNN